ncbi:MDR family oxidoreductase [Aestuariirhabdus litorea]|uniref:Oxidoreductase n=1 Tax=Aestuariirhabdus litorea TaxID=2528527 RepID=A0A3P3VTV9_9GAMM|nr:MDR family oxidoreductase [Aestuariirhabdus litorea]RRJ84889.1 oxidoreductase [Aestuariirhabdus litorea]RWW98116.1 acryloyl-CoA reductase [Endozoicomonadaceae bacterium GTF-13]
MFKGLIIKKDDQGYRCELADIDESVLPDGDVKIRVEYSTLNYKDALAITGKSPVVRQFPMIPGIDLVGTVEQSNSPDFKPGDRVLLNGWGVGEVHCGGLAEVASLKSQWLIRLPEGLNGKQAMAVGTAGYTAMLCINALEQNGLTPEQGPVLVTGANGGVGSFAVTLLSALGYQVIASTGRTEEAEYLKSLGASEIIDRAELSEPGRPLGKERWAAAIDSVGSHTLVNVCAGTKYGGSVAACGLAQGMDFPATVAPFILRGVSLLGIDSVMRPIKDRELAWARLAGLLDLSRLEKISREISLEESVKVAEELLAGKVRGRVVVAVAS